MHATARNLNVLRRLNGWAASLGVSGNPRPVLLSDDRSKVGPDATVRWTLTPVGASFEGRYSATAAAFGSSALLTADVFWPTGEQDSASNVYAPDEAADDIKSALSRLALTLLDYSTDPSNPTTVSDAYIRCIGVPEVRTLNAADGFSRRQVVASIMWMQAEND